MRPVKSALTLPAKAEEGQSPHAEVEITDSGRPGVPRGEMTERVRRHFDAIAKRYDLMNTFLSFGIHYLWKRQAVGFLGLGAGDRFLDLCGGTGDLSVLAARRIGPSGRIVLYDINRAMMEAGRQKSTHAGERGRVLYVQGDAQSSALQTGSFDAAIAGFGIRNLNDRVAGLREVFRVLKPGGRFVCLEFSRPATGWFRSLYDFYSFRIMPFLGRLIVGSTEAYTYLPESIRLFPSPQELAAVLEEIGFHRVAYRRLTDGIACLHSGVKPE